METRHVRAVGCQRHFVTTARRRQPSRVAIASVDAARLPAPLTWVKDQPAQVEDSWTMIPFKNCRLTGIELLDDGGTVVRALPCGEHHGDEIVKVIAREQMRTPLHEVIANSARLVVRAGDDCFQGANRAIQQSQRPQAALDAPAVHGSFVRYSSDGRHGSSPFLSTLPYPAPENAPRKFRVF
jgi:hypothetical protein